MERAAGVLTSIVLLFVLIVLIIVGLSGLGVIDFRWPWESIDLAKTESTVTFDEAAPEPKIIKIEPLTLACSSRVYAEVPVTATREHTIIGQTYRTDTVEMTAYGDVDTCVDSSEVRVEERVDGSFDVIIPADAIEFSRPRVDAVATMDSVVYDKGLIGKITDVFPWVSDNNTLGPAAYAFAQSVIGGSECMERAYDVTELALRQSYIDQMVAQGGDPASIEVIIDGVPDFTQNELGDDPKYEDFEFSVGGDAVLCEIAAGALPVPPESAEDL